jgi:hypothetical protein
MAYTLRVTFTGIIGLIHPLGDDPAPGVLVAPRGVQGKYKPPPPGRVQPQKNSAGTVLKRTALDGQSLPRHLAILRVHGAGEGFFDESLVYLDGDEVSFGFGGGTAPGLTVVDPQWLIPFPEVTQYHGLDRSKVSPDGPVVGATILVDRGTLAVSKGQYTWTIPGHLSKGGGDISGEFTHEAVWEVGGLSKAISITRKRGSAAPVTLALPRPDDGATLDVRISNLDPSYALEWEKEELTVAKNDEDFRWFYELLNNSDTGKTKSALNPGGSLPIPMNPRTISPGGAELEATRMGGGMNCLMAYLGQ